MNRRQLLRTLGAAALVAPVAGIAQSLPTTTTADNATTTSPPGAMSLPKGWEVGDSLLHLCYVQSRLTGDIALYAAYGREEAEIRYWASLPPEHRGPRPELLPAIWHDGCRWRMASCVAPPLNHHALQEMIWSICCDVYPHHRTDPTPASIAFERQACDAVSACLQRNKLWVLDAPTRQWLMDNPQAIL